MKDPAVLSRFFARFFDFKTCFQVGARGGYHKNIIFQFSSEGKGFKKWEPLVIYLYNRSDITSKKQMLSQRSTQHWSLTHQTGYPPKTGDGSERTKCRKFGDFRRLPWIQQIFIFWHLVICECWFGDLWEKWWFVNVENIVAKRTSMLPHGPTNSHF